ncbi:MULTISPECIES: lysylphosphatidylglycerol synthase transmembrane domain-containing protein [Haloarcula]|uniref:lysylphosphatidylglycerol synthase transmembrane domain-containing protein n=1 Tax=Haloarcula TaxID=2237 RepID=UPI0023EBD15B|nr:lysylphosphatidylglycerol synthase transmembrane domain-containing protein [Halomicroarcula sp. XH51]
MSFPEFLRSDLTTIRRAVSLGIGLALISVLVVVADTGAILNTLESVELGWYGVAFVIFTLGYFPATYRWLQLQRSIGYNPDVGATFEIVAISLGLNKVLPANLGDFSRSKVTERYFDVRNHAELLSLVAVERAADFFIALLLFTTSFALITSGAFLQTRSFIVAIGTFVAIVTVIVVFWLVRQRVAEWIPGPLSNQLEAAFSVADALSTTTLAVLFITTVSRWLLTGVVFVAVGRSIGVSPGFLVALALISGMSLVSVLPITPAGIGPSETVGVGILVASGVAYPTAISLSLLQRTFGVFWMGLIGLLIFLARWALFR